MYGNRGRGRQSKRPAESELAKRHGGHADGETLTDERERKEAQLTGVVTGVERHLRKANLYQVYINEQLAATVHEDVLLQFRLFRGQTIEASEARALLSEMERHAAWSDALSFVGRRPRALREVKLHLKRKGHSEGHCEEAVRRLEEQGYADDAQFASQIAEHRMLEQRKGRRWVQQELRQKGVKSDVIQGALEQVDPDAEREAARQLAERRWHSMSGEPLDKKRKLTAFLMRRGYGGALVQEVIREIMKREPAPETDDIWDYEGEMDMED